MIRAKFQSRKPVMDEHLTRLWAGAEADALGKNGIAIVEAATGMSRTTIRAGRNELRGGVDAGDVVNVRRAGGGRLPIEETNPEIVSALEAFVDPVTRGDPESPLRWTSKRSRKLAEELGRQGFRLSPQKVGQLLHAGGYSLHQRARVERWGRAHEKRWTRLARVRERARAWSEGQVCVCVDVLALARCRARGAAVGHQRGA